MMFAGKDPSTQEVVEVRTRIATGDEYSFMSLATLVPIYGHPMRGILAVEANDLGR